MSRVFPHFCVLLHDCHQIVTQRRPPKRPGLVRARWAQAALRPPPAVFEAAEGSVPAPDLQFFYFFCSFLSFSLFLSFFAFSVDIWRRHPKIHLLMHDDAIV
jgi:hypothetical protein